MEDEELVSRSFLSIFFYDVNNLKDALTGYRSIILRLEIKTAGSPTEALEKLDEETKNALIQWSDNVRHNVERCQLGIVALSQSIKEIETTELDLQYKKIIKHFAPELETVSKYAFEINKQFIKGTLDKLLNKMDMFYEQFKNQ